MADSHIEDAAHVAVDPNAPEKERHQARAEFGKWRSKQSSGLLEVIEGLSPQTDKERLPIKVGRRYFHSWKDTEKLYAEVTAWSTFDPESVCPATPPPPAVQAAFEEVFGDYIRSNGAILRLHPLYKRWTIFAKEPGPEGIMYRAMVMVQNSDGKYGHVPIDLQHGVDERLHPVLKNLAIGSYKEPTKQDFENLRNIGDRRRHGGTSKSRAKHFAKQEEAADEEGRKQLADFIDDFVSWNGALLARDINRKHGSMQGLPFVPQTSLEEFDRLHPMYEEVEALDPEGKPLGFKHRRRLKPFERGDFFTPNQKRMMALTAYGDYWKAAMEAAEADIGADDAKVAAEGRLKKVRLEFLDPALTDAELTEMVNTANAEMPGMVEALFGERGPRGLFDAEVAEITKRIEQAIKLQAWQESQAWRAKVGAPLLPPIEGLALVPEVVEVVESPDLELHDPRAPIPEERAQRQKEAAWLSRASQRQRSRS